MDLGVMILVILFGLCVSHIQAQAKYSFCKAAQRRSKSRILDMDFLLDLHYPVLAEQTEQIAGGIHPTLGHVDQIPALLNNMNAEHTMMNGIVNSEKKANSIRRKNIGKCNRRQPHVLNRDLLSTGQNRKISRKTRQNTSNHTSRRKVQENFNRDFRRKLHTLNKRFFVSRNLQHRPKSRIFKVDKFGNMAWKLWHSNGHIVEMTKRDVGNRRLKLSDLLTRAGLKKDKEEAIKVVLPLLLSDLRETPFKSRNPVTLQNIENLRIPLISASSSKQDKEMRNFRVKSDDGKEFNFRASAADVKHLIDILSKPNSSVVLENVSLNKNLSLVKNDNNRPAGIIKTTGTSQKAKEAANIPEGANTTECVAQLKEIENSVYERIIQMDVPNTHSKFSTAASPDTSTTKYTEATTISVTTES